jgi:hypothetical protein
MGWVDVDVILIFKLDKMEMGLVLVFGKLLEIGYLSEYNMRLNETDLKVRKRDKDETLLNEPNNT